MYPKSDNSLRQSFIQEKGTGSTHVNLRLDTLSRLQIIGYSVGHFQNDLCAACWFNYMLYFVKNVVFANSLDSSFYAGLVFLSGQIADGISTPLVGLFSDKTNTKYGKRTPWYIGGTIIVTISFLFIFQECLFCEWLNDPGSTMLTVYYILFPSLFNIGWACVQVSHMSLVPSLTLSRRQRDRLNTLRNTFTYIANLFVLTVAFLVFMTTKQGFEQFSTLSFISVGLGLITSIFFLCTLHEKKLAEDCQTLKKVLENNIQPSKIYIQNSVENTERSVECFETVEKSIQPRRIGNNKIEEAGRQPIPNQSCIVLSFGDDQGNITKAPSKLSFTWTKWFRLAHFYIYGFVYMGSRIAVNVQSSLIIFYLQNVLGMARGVNTYTNGVPVEFAIIPMIIYLSSTITSTLVKIAYEKIGRKKTYIVGTLISIIDAIAMMLLTENSSNWMFGLSILIGFSQSICLNTGIALISEVVGVRGSNAAFVFGAYSLLDKLANGIILYAIMNIKDVSDYSNTFYTRICSSVIPTCGALISCILVLIGNAKDYDSGDIVTEGSQMRCDEIKNLIENDPLNDSTHKK